MELLKEDGSLDIERINKLPITEFMDVIERLNGISRLHSVIRYKIIHKCQVVLDNTYIVPLFFI